MRVGIYYSNKDVRVEEMPVPQIGADELLVKVLASGICGSDVMEWYRKKKAPLVLGHEIAGVIAEAGKNVSKYKVGERVFVSHHVPCNTCRYCLDGNHTVCETLHTTNFYPGGFAEYIRVPALNVDRGVFTLPDNMTFAAGTFIEPLACVWRGQKLVGVMPEHTVLILGGGLSGLLHLMLAKSLGAHKIVVTDISRERLEKAKEFGAIATISAKEDVPARLREINGGRLADIVIVCTGALPAFQQALNCLDRAGTLLCFAPTDPGVTIPVPVQEFWRNSIRILHSYGASPADLQEALALIAGKAVPVEKMITHELPLEEIGKGFKLAAEAKNCLKVIINPEQSV